MERRGREIWRGRANVGAGQSWAASRERSGEGWRGSERQGEVEGEGGGRGGRQAMRGRERKAEGHAFFGDVLKELHGWMCNEQ